MEKNMPPKPNITNDPFYGQFSESIKMVFDLTSRIDERVKMLIEGQSEMESKFNKLIETTQNAISELKEEITEINIKVAVMENYEVAEELQETQKNLHALEIRTEKIDNKVGNHDKSWGRIFDAVWKVSLMLIAGFILYKLGIQAPPN